MMATFVWMSTESVTSSIFFETVKMFTHENGIKNDYLAFHPSQAFSRKLKPCPESGSCSKILLHAVTLVLLLSRP